MITRRLFAAGLLAAPAIVRASSLMPIKAAAPIVPNLFRGESGHWDGIRIIQAPTWAGSRLHEAMNDFMQQRMDEMLLAYATGQAPAL